VLAFWVAALTTWLVPASAAAARESTRQAASKTAPKAKPKAKAPAAKPSGKATAARGSTATSRASAARSRGTSRKGRAPVRAVRVVVPPRPSHGEIYGLRDTDDPLDLKSSVALVVDSETDEVLFSKNPQAVLPIASITKLMTALVVTEAKLPLDEELIVTQDDVDTEKGSRSRLAVGTRLTRGEMLHLALMASENRAAHALGRHYPGGLPAFVAHMNRTAQRLGMQHTRYVEPTGLSSRNQSSASDLALLVRATMEHPAIREMSTSLEADVAVGQRQLQFRNTNGLMRVPGWVIHVQKTGYISEAGRCVVMQAELAGRRLIMVLLDSAGRYSRIGDAERLRKWLAEAMPTLGSSAAPAPAPDAQRH
jgi:D-alanyl-D-alanine endopeptidase (penicillin-binding protein 7)